MIFYDRRFGDMRAIFNHTVLTHTLANICRGVFVARAYVKWAPQNEINTRKYIRAHARTHSLTRLLACSLTTYSAHTRKNKQKFCAANANHFRIEIIIIDFLFGWSALTKNDSFCTHRIQMFFLGFSYRITYTPTRLCLYTIISAHHHHQQQQQ